MRRESSITSLSWLPSEAVEGSTRLAFDAGMAHYEAPLVWTTPSLTIHSDGKGEVDSEVFLLRDGVLRVEEGGRRLAGYEPGALLGERAHLEGGQRASTLVAVTPCRVAAVEAAALDRGALQELAKGHRRTRPDRS